MPPKKKAFLNDDNLERLLAALEAPASVPVVRSQTQVKPKPLITLGNWKPTEDTPQAKSKKKQGKASSVFHRVIDVLSRGNYASAEAFKEAFDPKTKEKWEVGQGFKGFWSGLQGKEKTRFKEVLDERGHKGKGMGTLGVALDIFADPLTYAGVGLVGKGVQTAGRTRKARFAEAAKPDVVQLGISGSRAIKRKATTGSFRRAPVVDAVAPVTAGRVSATSITPVATSTAVLFSALSKTTDMAPKEAAAAAARISRVVDKGATKVGAAKKRPKEYSVEELLPEIAKLQAATVKTEALAANPTKAITSPKVETPEQPKTVKRKADHSEFENKVATKHKVPLQTVTKWRQMDEPQLKQIHAGLLPEAKRGVPAAQAKIRALNEVVNYKKTAPKEIEVAVPVADDLTKQADTLFEKDMKMPPGSMAELRTAAIANDVDAIDDLKAYETSPYYRTAQKQAEVGNTAPVAGERASDDLMADVPAVPKLPEGSKLGQRIKLTAGPHKGSTATLTKINDDGTIGYRLDDALVDTRAMPDGSSAPPPPRPKAGEEGSAFATVEEEIENLQMLVANKSGRFSEKQIARWQKQLDELTGAANPVAKPVESVPEKLANTPPPKEMPTPLTERLIETDQTLSSTQRQVARSTVAETLDILQGAKKANLNNADVGAAKRGGAGAHTEFTPIKQANAFNRVFQELLVKSGYRKGTPRKQLMADESFRTQVIDTWRHVETAMEAAGKAPVAWQNNLTPLRLSDFLARMTPDELMQADFPFITKLMTGRTGVAKYDDMRAAVLAGAHTEDAAKSIPVINSITEAVAIAAKDPTSDATADLLKSIKSMARDAARQGGVSVGGSKVIEEIASEAAFAAKADSVGFTTVGNLTTALEQARNLTTKGDVVEATRALERLNRDADKFLGIYIGGEPAVRLLNVSKMGKGMRNFFSTMDKTEEWLGLKFSTAFGKDADGAVVSMGSELKNASRRAINNANQRSQQVLYAYRDMFAGAKSGDDRLRMYRDMQADPDKSPVGMRFARMEELAGNNGIDIKTLNDYYIRHYKKADDKPLKLNEDLGFKTWLDPSVQIKGDIAQHLFKLETALDKAIVDKQIDMWFTHTMGQKTPATGLVQATSDSKFTFSPAVEGRYFTPEDLQNFKNMRSMVRDLENESSAIFKNFDKVQGIWKTMATRANPQYYVRNGVGETFINWLHGVPVSAYVQSRDVMKWRNGDIAVDALQGAKPVEGNSVIIRHPKFGNVTSDMLYTGFANSGAKQTFAITDNLTDASLSKAPNKTMQSFNAVADYEEGFFRMAHFIHEVKRSKAKTFEEAANDAAIAVNRAHGDYADLTRFEQKVMKRIIPFYTWQRKVTPTLLESSLRNPGKVMVYPKIQIALAQNYGLELDNSNPFPQPDFLLPDYLADAAAVPYYTRANGNPVLGDPGNPFNDQLRDLSKPNEFAENSLSPFVKTPVEMFVRSSERNPKGTRFFGDAPIKDRTDYLADQIPLLSTFNRITRNQTGPGTNKAYSEDEKGVNFIALMNWLTASRLSEVTDRVEKSGEFDEIARQRKAKEKAEKK